MQLYRLYSHTVVQCVCQSVFVSDPSQSALLPFPECTLCNVPFVYPTPLSSEGAGFVGSITLVEYTDGRVSLPRRM